MPTKVVSPYAAPNSPIASAKKSKNKRQQHGDDPDRAPSSPLASAESSSSNLFRTFSHFTALFSPAPEKGDQEKDGNGRSPNPSESVLRHGERTRISPAAELTNPSIHNEDDDEDYEEFNPYFYIAHLPPHVTIPRHKSVLPKESNFEFTLALDLDETLVHCSVEPIACPDVIFPVNLNGAHYKIYARMRPYLHYFLESVSTMFEVVVFTASQKVYADKLLDHVDPQKTMIKHRLFRDSCVSVHGNFVKDLSVLGRELGKTILVDNSPHAYAYNVNNGVPIESWFDDESDTELLKLLGFLKKVDKGMDVRPLIRDHFKSYLLVARAREGFPCSLKAPPF
jgi:CTD small phosphatase-like protein 2